MRNPASVVVIIECRLRTRCTATSQSCASCRAARQHLQQHESGEPAACRWLVQPCMWSPALADMRFLVVAAAALAAAAMPTESSGALARRPTTAIGWRSTTERRRARHPITGRSSRMAHGWGPTPGRPRTLPVRPLPLPGTGCRHLHRHAPKVPLGVKRNSRSPCHLASKHASDAARPREPRLWRGSGLPGGALSDGRRGRDSLRGARGRAHDGARRRRHGARPGAQRCAAMLVWPLCGDTLPSRAIAGPWRPDMPAAALARICR